jgi:hypothetical protein
MAGETTGAPAEGAPADKVAAVAPKPAFTVDDKGGRVRELVKPIIGHNGTITHMTLRKPSYRDVMTFGDPEALIVVNGGYVPQTDMVLIERYIITLSGVDSGLLEQLDYLDALALRDAVRSFFR